LKVCLSCFYLIALSLVSFGQTQDMPGRIQVIETEMSRNFEALKKEQVPPYYMSYSIDEVRTQFVTATFGAIASRNDDTTSYLRINLRTGSYKLDNSHELRGDSLGAIRSRLSIPIRAPLDESPEGLALILWKETDKAYRNAVETLSKVKSEQSVKIAEEDKSDDFSKVEPHQSIAKPLNIQVDLDKWAARVRKYTALFKQQPYIYDSSGSFQSMACLSKISAFTPPRVRRACLKRQDSTATFKL
jgi:TldD protein